MPNLDLPIWQEKQSILQALTHGNRLVLVAPTGSGKTTQVPQMLLEAGLSGDRQVVVLQPRRVAARTVASRVAWEMNTRVGDRVGYQIRFDDSTSLGTRICFVTEGILLRWLQDDRELRRIGVLLFDEFHERNLLSDVALALVKQLQVSRRPELKIAVMSATLDAAPVAHYLASDTGPAPLVQSQGRMFPVEIRWSEYGDQRPASEQAADAVEGLIRNGEQGDMLVFMPGMAEINSTINALRAARLGETTLIPLHGDLPAEDQDRAFQSSPRRKIIVATNVAETSVTIDGIRHVIDSGLARVARFDSERGLQTLLIEEISRASADQRAGRAGRTAPGVCWRMWTESGHLNRPARNTPEIQRADLAEVVLLLHSLGVKRAAEFDWLDRPDISAVERAEALLAILGALSPASVDTVGAVSRRDTDMTPIGRQMLRLPMHPRFSRMLVEASKRGCVPAASLCAALVSGRDLLIRLGRDDRHLREARELFEGSNQSDFFTLMRAHAYARQNGFAVEACRRYGIHAQTARLVEDTFRQILEIARREGLAPNLTESAPADASQDSDALAKCILAGFVDQLAIRRDAGSLDCDVAGGRQGVLLRESVVQDAKLFVAASLREVDGRTGLMTLLAQATAVKLEWLRELYPEHFTASVEHLFDRTHRRVAAVRLERFLGVLVDHKHQRDVDPDDSGACLAKAFTRGWFELPRLDHSLRQWIARVNLVARIMPDLEIPRFDEVGIEAAAARAFRGLTLAKEAQAADLRPAFEAHLKAGQSPWIDELAPSHLNWPGEKRIALKYPEEPDGDSSPEAQVKLTDIMGATLHPTVCEGRVPIQIWLMTPEGKRLESTLDWTKWRSQSYPKLRSALQRKFPSFAWP